MLDSDPLVVPSDILFKGAIGDGVSRYATTKPPRITLDQKDSLMLSERRIASTESLQANGEAPPRISRGFQVRQQQLRRKEGRKV